MHPQTRHHIYHILDSLAVGVFVLRPDYTVAHWNSTLELWTGIMREGVLNAPISDVFPAITPATCGEVLQPVFEASEEIHIDGQTCADLMSIADLNGKPHNLRATVSALRDASGEVEAVFSIQDLSRLSDKPGDSYSWVPPREPVEREPRPAPALGLQALFSAMSDLILVLDRDGRYLSAPSTAASVTIPVENFAGKTVYDIFASPLADRFIATTRQALDSKQSVSLDYSVDYLNGVDIAVRAYLASVSPMTENAAVWVIRDVTASRQAEDRLRASESELRALFAAMTDTIIVIDGEGRYVRIPETGAQINRSPDEVLGHRLHDFLDAAQADAVLDGIHEALNTHRPVTVEYVITINDREHWRTAILSPMGDGTVMAVIRDITEYKHAEQALARSKTEFEAIFNAIGVAAIFTDPDRQIVRCNPAMAAVFGYHPEELIGQTTRVLYANPADYETMGVILYNRENRTALPSYECRYHRKSGEEFVGETIGAPVLGPGEEVIGFLAIVRDVTERTEAQEALRQSELRLRTLMETLPAAVFMYKDGQVPYVNPAVEALTGYKPEEIDLERFFSLVHPDYMDAVNLWFEHDMLTRTYPAFYEFKIVNRAGEERWVDVTIALIQFGGDMMVLGTAVDVTDRKRAREQDVQLTVERERTKVLADFIRDASHDFRTPLSTIRTSIYLMRRHSDEAKRAQQYDVLERQVDRLEKLVDGLFTMSRLDSSTGFRYVPVNLNELLNNVQVRATPLAAAKNHTLRFSVEELPSLNGDPVELQRALLAIVENAVDFTLRGGFIDLTAVREGSTILIRVRDTGIGIGPADLPYVFDRFYKADKARPAQAGGLGLGLSIARKIVETHGGHIEVDSVAGEGSEFCISLPIDRPMP